MSKLSSTNNPYAILAPMLMNLDAGKGSDHKLSLSHGGLTASFVEDGLRRTIDIHRYGDDRGIAQITTCFRDNLNAMERIEEAKELSAQGLKQVAIADILGVSQPSVSRYLRS